MCHDITAGLTTAEIARRYRVSPDKVREWIRRGELHAVNTAKILCGKPRWVVTPESLAVFERGRAGGSPLKHIKRNKRTDEVDYFPDL